MIDKKGATCDSVSVIKMESKGEWDKIFMVHSL